MASKNVLEFMKLIDELNLDSEGLLLVRDALEEVKRTGRADNASAQLEAYLKNKKTPATV